MSCNEISILYLISTILKVCVFSLKYGNHYIVDSDFDTLIVHQGIARTQSPTNKNYAFELPTFGVIVGVSLAEVQWKGLALEEPPS